MTDVWITLEVPDDCQCWRDALCSHGFTWQDEAEHGGEACRHIESYLPVHFSLADAVRDLYSNEGKSVIGCLLRERIRIGDAPLRTHAVFVMRKGDGPFIDDHLASDGPTPKWVISRYRSEARSTPENDVGKQREFANVFRDV